MTLAIDLLKKSSEDPSAIVHIEKGKVIVTKEEPLAGKTFILSRGNLISPEAEKEPLAHKILSTGGKLGLGALLGVLGYKKYPQIKEKLVEKLRNVLSKPHELPARHETLEGGAT
jgi:hypothetical protein